MSKNPEWETPVVGQTDWTAEIPPSSTFTEEQLAATNEAKLYRDEAEAFKNQSQAISADISVKYDDIIVRFAEFEVVAENLQNQINQVNAAVEDASDSAAAAQASASAASGAQAGAETAQAAAQTAQGLAQTAQTGAETARTDAQTARTQAQTARTDAQTARNASQAAQSASEGARDASVTARNASQAAQTAAETARGNAETFANNASGSATASDTARQASQAARDQAQTARTDAQSARDTALGYRDAAQTARDEAVAAAEGINPDQFLLRSGGEMTGRLRITLNPTGQAGVYPVDLVNNANQGASGSTWRDASLINLDNFSPAIRFRDRTTGAASLIMGVDGNQLQFWSEDDTGALVKRGYFNLTNGQFFQGTTRLAPVASPPLTGTPTAPTAAKGTNTAQIATMAAIIEALTDYYTAAQLDARQWGGANLADGAVSGQKVADGGIASEAKLWATARKDLSDRVLIGKWSGTELGGLTQILLDLPAEFENFQLLESNIRSTNTSAALILRIGPTAGGAVDQGANDYANILMGYSGGGSGVSLSYASANWAFVRPISTQAGKSVTDFSDGSWGIGWSGLSTSIYYDVAATRDNLVQRGHRRNANTGRTNRLQIGFNAALVNGGAIRLYGIR